MNTFRIALANIRFPATPAESVALAEQAIARAFIEHAGLICFPECFVPGYRGGGKHVRLPILRSSNGPGPPSPQLRRKRISPWSSARSASSTPAWSPLSLSSIGTERSLVSRTKCNWTRQKTIPIRRDPGGGFFKPVRWYSVSPSATRVGAIRKQFAGPSSTAHHRVPPSLPRSRARRLPARKLRRSCKFVPRESSPLSRR